MSNDKHQFIYILRLIPRLIDDSSWTENDEKIIEKHFKILKDLKDDGRLILAGRTLNKDEDNFGIVILSVNKEEEARMLMEKDPAVAEGIMTAKLYPYSVALISEQNSAKELS